MIWLVALGILLIVFLLVIFVYFQSKGFITEHYDFYSDKVPEDFHFVFISDLHEVQHGDKNCDLIAAIKKASPSYVLIGGDILTSYKSLESDFEDIIDFIKNLSLEFSVIFVPGNHERALFDIRDCDINLKPKEKDAEDIIRITRFEQCLLECNIPVLRNSKFFLRNQNVTIYGLDLGLEYYRRLVRRVPERDLFVNLLGEVDEDSYSIMLAHDPEHFKEYADWKCDLVLSGHLHGGIVRVPLLGGLVSPQLRIFPKYDSGVFKEGNSHMLLTRGIGFHSLPIRVFNKAEVCDVIIHKC